VPVTRADQQRRGARLRRAAASISERLEAGAVLLVLLIAGGVWAFVELADEVLEGETATIDRALLLLLRTPGDPSDPLGPPWFEEIVRDLTALGGIAVLTLLTLVVAAFLALRRMRGAAWLLLLATGSGMLASFALKDLFDRPRPDLVPHGMHVASASFPSGHSMMAAIVYLTLGALLARVQPKRRIKAFVLSVSILLAVIVGISRVYLGVHWPTDVLAGWTVGAAWALMFWLLARWLQRTGQVETGNSE
jgi:undecaprenyl-diphosphatase